MGPHPLGLRTALGRAGPVLLLLAACSSRTEPFETRFCEPGAVRCSGSVAATCNAQGTGYGAETVCEGHSPECAPGLGCVACLPGARRCQGNAVLECDPAGDLWQRAEICEGETVCYLGACGGACARAGLERSYEGCDYRAVTLMSQELSADFTPAVVVSNRNDEPVTVTVTRGEDEVAVATVQPRSTGTIELPWVLALKEATSSMSLPGAAYRVRSSLPVTLYQFNPLEYSLPRDCTVGDVLPGDGVCHSYTNDASLLLPVQVLGRHYIVMSRANLGIRVGVEGRSERFFLFSPSVFAVVNPHDHPVDVEIRFSAPTAGGPRMRGYAPGDVATFTLAADGVLQIAAATPESCEPDWLEPETVPCGGGDCRYGYCELAELDLTGTEVVATEPVAVFGAHDCAFVPFNRWACDHLEEQLFPFETWGRRFVASQAYRERGEPDVFRVLSGQDGNRVRFSPASVHEPVVLDRGEHVELEAHGAFEIEADGPVLVGQFLVGQSYGGLALGEDLPPGDPSFSLVVPVEQYRSRYNFLAPSSFDRSFVNLTATTEAAAGLRLDGASLADAPWEEVPGTDIVVLRHEISPGSHEVVAAGETAVGITVYGYGQYTSYMYPGGLALEPIAVW